MRGRGWGVALVVALVAAWLWLRASSSATPSATDAGLAEGDAGSLAGDRRGAVADPRNEPSSEGASAPVVGADGGHGRVAREELRRRIYEAFGEMPPEAGSPARSGNAAESRSLDLEYVRAHLQSDFVPLAKECVQSVWSDGGAPEMNLVLGLRVVGDEKVGGVVESTDILDGGTPIPDELADCLRGSMESLSMPPPTQGGSFTLHVPMRYGHRPADAGD